MTMRILHDVTRSLDFLEDDEPFLTYRYARELYKPYLHPIRVPGGHCISLDKPHDHPHHRGLFFGWPNLSGVDFWTEHDADKEPGRITHLRFDALEFREEQAHAAAVNAWVDAQGRRLMKELCTIVVGPAEERHYVIDLGLDFTAAEEAVEFGSPPAFHGLAYRAVRSMDRGELLNSEGQMGEEDTCGAPAKWVDYSGRLDGTDEWAGLCIMDHPSNPRYPSPFYTQAQHFGFITAAFAYHEPFVLSAKDVLELKYRVIVHAGRMSADELNELHEAFISEGV